MNIVVLGPKGGEAKIALHDGRGLQKDFLNKSFVKKVLGQPYQEIRAEQNDSIRDDTQRKREAKRTLNLESVEEERQVPTGEHR